MVVTLEGEGARKVQRGRDTHVGPCMGRCGFYGQLSEEDELGPCESGANATWCPQLSSSLKVLLAMRLTLPISAPTGSFGRAATRIPQAG
jgi:hypothetical protein